MAAKAWLCNLPKLNKARYGASACFLAGYVYVFCGFITIGACTKIEKICAPFLVSNSKSTWTIIEVPRSILKSRIGAAVVQTSDTEIVILGGLHGV